MIGTRISIFSNRLQIKRGMVFGLLIVSALLAFELFNYSTTDFALSDLLGDLKFLGFRWATILAVAFCGIDFAGIARLFTPEQGADEPAEVWYLFGAWMLAALMNAMLTWWGVVPIFVAVMVWLIRVLIIGTISMAGDRLFSQAKKRPSRNSQRARPRTSKQTNFGIREHANRALNNTRPSTIRHGVNASSFRPSPKPQNQYISETDYQHSEPTYSPVSFKSTKANGNRQVRF
jgi:hypothetical protein